MKRRMLRVQDGSGRYPFTTGPIVEVLQVAGVGTDEALRIARDLERSYQQRGERGRYDVGDRVIDLGELMQRLQQLVRDRLGREVAESLARQTPPFTVLEVVGEGGGRNPFSRRRLATSLEKLSLSFKEAFSVVRQVELGLRADGRREVPERELYMRVASSLGARYGRDVRARYEARLTLAAELVVVEGDGTAGLPFSRGVLAQSLLSIGLDMEFAHRLARRTEDQLWRLGAPRVNSEQVRLVVRQLVHDEAGEEFARRYTILRSLKQSERPLVVLISGAAGVGKSVLAAELGYRLGIARVVSTDSVRQALRSLISPELSPILHTSSYAAWRAELLPYEVEDAKPKRKRVVRGFQAQVMQMSRAIDAIIERNVRESMSVLIEGTHLVPGLSPMRPDDRALVVELVLVVADEADHRENFLHREGRARLRPSSDYLEHFAEIRMIQDFMLEQAKREGATVVDTSDFDRAVERAVEKVLDAMTAHEEGEEGAVANANEAAGRASGSTPTPGGGV